MKLAKRLEQVSESVTLAVSAKAAKMQAEGIDVIGFGAGEPDFDTPDNIRRACCKALDEGHTRYPKPATGLIEARKAVCAKLARENDLKYTPEQVLITNGGKMALALAMLALLDPGDEVIIPVPYWVSYPEITRLAGGIPVYAHGLPGNDFRLRPRDLESVLTSRTKLFCLTSPSNPSGVTYSPDEVRALERVLRGRGIAVISDEIYDRLLFNGQQTISYAAVSEEAYRHTLTVNAASKTYAMTGWRIGYAAGPLDWIRGMSVLQSQTTSGVPTFLQYALVEALMGDQQTVERMRAEFERRGEHMHRRLTSIPGITCPKPTGAFYCFPDVSALYAKLGVSGSGEFSAKLLEEARVAVVPGIGFGMDTHVRLSFATSMKQIDEGIDRIEKFMARRSN